MPIINVNTCTSTNTCLLEYLEKQRLEEGSILTTYEQSNGRGQRGNLWEAEVGKNLTFSMVFYPDFLLFEHFFLLSEAVAVGVKDTLDNYVNDLTVKWSNDIYYQDRKLAGILIENKISASLIEQSVVGIGINVNQEVFRSDAPNPVSLKQIIGKEVLLDDLLNKLSVSVLSRYRQLQNGDREAIVKDYHAALYRRDGYFAYQDRNGVFLARIESVGDDGRLHLICDDGKKRSYAFKEIKFV